MSTCRRVVIETISRTGEDVARVADTFRDGVARTVRVGDRWAIIAVVSLDGSRLLTAIGIPDLPDARYQLTVDE